MKRWAWLLLALAAPLHWPLACGGDGCLRNTDCAADYVCRVGRCELEALPAESGGENSDAASSGGSSGGSNPSGGHAGNGGRSTESGGVSGNPGQAGHADGGAAGSTEAGAAGAAGADAAFGGAR
jgi:hypothetical protein